MFEGAENKNLDALTDNAVVRRWEDIPEIWKKVEIPKEVNLELKPGHNSIKSIFGDIVSNDDLRPVFSGVYFGDAVVATDGFRIFGVDKKPQVNKKSVYDFNGKEIEGNFPNYGAVIPEYETSNVTTVDLVEIKTYCQAVKRGQYISFISNQINIKDTDGGIIGFNSKLLTSICDAFLKLGKREVYVAHSDPDKGMMFSDQEQILTDPAGKRFKGSGAYFAILMPVMVENGAYGAQDMDFQNRCYSYIDLSQGGRIVNEDGSPADFNDELTSPTNPFEKDMKVIKKVMPNSPSLPILENIAVRDGVLIASNLENFYMRDIGGALSDGLFYPVNGFLRRNNDDAEHLSLSEFPVPPTRSESFDKKPVPVLSGDPEILSQAFLEASYFTDNDEMRPAMSGVYVQSKEGERRVVSTNAKMLYIRAFDAEQSLSERNFIHPSPRIVSEALNLSSADQATFYVYGEKVGYSDYLGLVSGDIQVVSRGVEGKYPDHEAILKKTTVKGYYEVDKKTVNNCLKQVKGKKTDQYVLFGESAISLYDAKEDATKKLCDVSPNIGEIPNEESPVGNTDILLNVSGVEGPDRSQVVWDIRRDQLGDMLKVSYPTITAYTAEMEGNKMDAVIQELPPIKKKERATKKRPASNKKQPKKVPKKQSRKVGRKVEGQKGPTALKEGHIDEDFETYLGKVYQAVATEIGIDQGDAEGIVGAKEQMVKDEYYSKGKSAEEAAKALTGDNDEPEKGPTALKEGKIDEDFESYLGSVYQAVATDLDIDRGDAQGIVDAKEQVVKDKYYEKGKNPEEAAKALTGEGEVGDAGFKDFKGSVVNAFVKETGIPETAAKNTVSDDEESIRKVFEKGGTVNDALTIFLKESMIEGDYGGSKLGDQEEPGPADPGAEPFKRDDFLMEVEQDLVEKYGMDENVARDTVTREKDTLIDQFYLADKSSSDAIEYLKEEKEEEKGKGKKKGKAEPKKPEKAKKKTAKAPPKKKTDDMTKEDIIQKFEDHKEWYEKRGITKQDLIEAFEQGGKTLD